MLGELLLLNGRRRWEKLKKKHILGDGSCIDAEAVILATGVRPRIDHKMVIIVISEDGLFS